MKRRSFVKRTAAATAALSFPFTLPAGQRNTEYSILELMGKIDIPLFGKGINLREEAYDAYVDMKKAAYQDGFDIKMVSSYRDFYRQEGIWERKYLRYTEDDGMAPLDAIDKIIEYSTIPGTSRHHWGTDIDIIDGYPKTNGSVLVPEKFESGGPFEGLKRMAGRCIFGKFRLSTWYIQMNPKEEVLNMSHGITVMLPSPFPC